MTFLSDFRTRFEHLIRNRSLPGCGFLLALPLVPLHAQRGPELSLTTGVSLAQPAIRRTGLPAAFGTDAAFNTAAVLRATLPLSPRLGLGLEQRLTGLSQTFRYRYADGNGRRSSGLKPDAVYQTGLSLRLYDLLLLGPHWHLDAAMTGSYAWASPKSLHAEYQLLGSDAAAAPRPDAPQVRVQQHRLRPGAWMAGTEVVLAYELNDRHSLLFTVGYQRGLQSVMELRSLRADFVDDAGTVRHGSLVLTTRCSYATAQFGYSLNLAPAEAARRRNPTPRYSTDPEAPEEDEPSTE